MTPTSWRRLRYILKPLSEKTSSIADFSEKEFAYLTRVNQIAGNIKAVLDMEKAYADIDLEKLDEDLDIDADGLMEELSELLMKELTGLDLNSDNLEANMNSDDVKPDPSTVELPLPCMLLGSYSYNFGVLFENF